MALTRSLKRAFSCLVLILQTECHSLPHFEWCTDDPPPHNGTDIFNQDPPVHLIHQCLSQSDEQLINQPNRECVRMRVYSKSYLIWRAVHSAELFKVLFNSHLNALIGLSVFQPLPLHQLIEEWLESRQKIISDALRFKSEPDVHVCKGLTLMFSNSMSERTCTDWLTILSRDDWARWEMSSLPRASHRWQRSTKLLQSSTQDLKPPVLSQLIFLLFFLYYLYYPWMSFVNIVLSLCIWVTDQLSHDSPDSHSLILFYICYKIHIIISWIFFTNPQHFRCKMLFVCIV